MCRASIVVRIFCYHDVLAGRGIIKTSMFHYLTFIRRARIFRCALILTSLNILIFAAFLRGFRYQNRNANFFQERRAFDIPPTNTVLSYIHQQQKRYTAASIVQEQVHPNTTAVILNWSRLENVLLISSVLCGQWLDDVLVELFIGTTTPRL